MQLDGAFANERWTGENEPAACANCDCRDDDGILDPECDCECHWMEIGEYDETT